MFDATALEPVASGSSLATSRGQQQADRKRHKLRNGAACSNCRISKNKCQGQGGGEKCLRCVSYTLECDAPEELAPSKRTRKGAENSGQARVKRKRVTAGKNRDLSDFSSSLASKSPSAQSQEGDSRRPSTAQGSALPTARPSRPSREASTVDQAHPLARSSQSTPSHSTLVDNHARQINEEDFTRGYGDRIGGLYHIPDDMWWSPALVFDNLIVQREEILASGESAGGSFARPCKPSGSSWSRAMDPALAAELSSELTMLINEVLVDRLSSWQFHRPRLSPSKPPTCRLYLYTLMLLATIHNPALFQSDTHARLKSATEHQLLQTILHSVNPSVETALALELLARWLPLPSDGATLMDLAVRVGEKVGCSELAALQTLDERRVGVVSYTSLDKSKVWYGLKLSNAIVNIGLGKDTQMPPSNILAEVLGPLNLQASAGVQDCQLLILYRFVEYVVSALRSIRMHVDDPRAMRQTIDAICDYCKATLSEIAEYQDNAEINAADIQALRAEVSASESQLICQLSRHFAGHFRAELLANEGLRDTLGMNANPAYGNAWEDGGWVDAIIHGAHKFLDPACHTVLTLHRLGEIRNSSAGHYRCWPRHTLNHVAFSFMVIIQAQISSYAFNMNGDGMGLQADYLDMILAQARHILTEARVPIADVASSLLEVWQRRKESTARYFRQKARQRQQARLDKSKSAEAELLSAFQTPSSGSGSGDGFADARFLFDSSQSSSAPLFAHMGEMPSLLAEPGGLLQSQQTIDAWFESIFAGMDDVGFIPTV